MTILGLVGSLTKVGKELPSLALIYHHLVASYPPFPATVLVNRGRPFVLKFLRVLINH
jgi:hypothetical protein